MGERSIVAVLSWACGLAVVFVVGARAEDWPQWRGLERDGKLAGFVAPKVWPDKLKRQWNVEVGTGHASPVVVGEHVFLISREDDQEVVRSLDLADGRVRWSQRYPAPYEMNQYAKSHGKGPKSTPVVADSRLFTLGISGVLSCWDTATGKPLWQQEFAGRYEKTSPLYGAAMSPVVEAGLLIAHVGGHDQGALTAFDAESGQVRWQWDGDGPGYTSPIVTTLAGTRLVLTQSQNHSLAVSASDGALLWSLPFKTAYDQNIITPLLVEDLVIFSGLGKGTTAYRFRKRGSKVSPEEVWHNADASMYMASPVIVAGRLFGMARKDRGRFFCLDAATGKTLWTSEGRMGDNAAFLATGTSVLALTTGGELLVLDAAAERFEPLARYPVADTPTWAHPAFVGNQVLIKDKTSLALWSLGAR